MGAGFLIGPYSGIEPGWGPFCVWHRMAKRTYSDETKAAVKAALLEGQGVSRVAKDYKIPEGTVKAWKSRLKKEGVAEVAPQKKKEIGDLLIEYLHENLETLRSQSEHFRDKDWLKDQSADDLAVLHGVMCDKAVRLLEAIGNAGASNADPDQE